MMKDLLKKNKWRNGPLQNETQNTFRRFQKVPWTGLPNYLEDYEKRLSGVFSNDSFQTTLSQITGFKP